MRAVRQLLDVVRRELGATDAYVQIGGNTPDDPCVVTFNLDTGVRLVARFTHAPADREDAEDRLQTVAEAFAQTVNDSIVKVTQEVAVTRPATRRSLVDALVALAEGARATVAVVVDVRSPVLWGSSDAGLGLQDVEEAEQLADDEARLRHADIDPSTNDGPTLGDGEDRDSDDRATTRSLARLRARFGENPAAARRDITVARAIAWARAYEPTSGSRHEPGLGVLMHAFAGMYRLVLVFDGPFSELVAEPITRRALPVIERLVAGLPPLDPTPEGALVVPLRPKG